MSFLRPITAIAHTEEEDTVRIISARLATSAKDRTMKPKFKPPPDEMRSEYDFSGGVRGKYFHRFMQSSNVVVLEPDAATAFPNAEAVSAKSKE